MRFVAWTKPETDDGNTVFLRLKREGDAVLVVAVNNNGNELTGGELASFGGYGRGRSGCLHAWTIDSENRDDCLNKLLSFSANHITLV